MNSSILEQKREYEEKRRKRKFWKSIVTVLSCVVVFCTTYALILPAITMENTAYCGYEEHAHGEECYTLQLICTQTDEVVEGHEHESDCFEQQKTLICDMQEIAAHVHSPECESVEVIIGCGLEESEEHTHNEECNTEQLAYICGLEETEGHTHLEECYATSEELVCDKETEDIILEHVHTEECYEKTFTCELTEHAHEKMCYSNPKADLETAEDWEVTLPAELSGIWAEDLIAVAESQLGYKESRKNYVVAEDGEIKGYSRYGDWYGSSYGDWCAMYISFCLHYAGIDEGVMPREAGCQNWIEVLASQEHDLYRFAAEYEPVAGDLVFFNNDAEEDSDHVGIVISVTDKTEEAEAQIKVIEGNTSDEVAYRTYNLTDPTIMGYGVLPIPKEIEMTVEEESESLMKTFALRNVSDAYAPEGVSLTGVWSEDLITIANSQVGYSEVNSLSKYDQWAGNYGTNYWNVNFVNYCLHYAGVDSDAIPWNTSYDFSQWIGVLEEKGLYRTYNANQMKPGDIVFVQGWNAGQNLNVGVCVESSGGAFYIVFGDMDANGRVVKEQFWENWTGRLLGYVSLSDSLETSVDGVLTASVGYNGGSLPQGTDLVVELIKDQEDYRNLIETNLKPAGSQIQEDYYLDIYFTKDGQILYPNESLDIKIDFTTPLTPDSSAVESGEEIQWIHGLIADGMISEAMGLVQTELDSNGCIKKAVVSCEPNATYAFASVQETKVQLTAEAMTGETKVMATAVGNATVFLEDMQMEIRFIEDGTEEWVSKIEEIYTNEKELVSANRFFEVIFKDADGNPVSFPENTKVALELTFNPPVSAAFSDGSNARTGNWKLNTIETISGNVTLEELDAKLTTAKNISLESVAFNGYKPQPYALSAVVINPAYTETVVNYYELSDALKNGDSIAQIKLGADIIIPSNGGFTIESGKKVFFDLNGYDIITDGTLFTIKDGAEVSISDSKAAAEITEEVAQMHLRADEDGDSAAQLAVNKANVGTLAVYDSANEKLTYYVTKTEITDSTVGATKETLVKHTADLKGNIKSGSEAAIKVEGGTFQMESGAITGCLDTAILQTGGRLNLTGGYICNNHKTSGNGGAIHSTEDAVIVADGTVIAANSASGDGGAIYIDGKEIVFNSGVISGNQAGQSGGGAFCKGATNVEITGGYITNNRADSTEYRGGGGGIFTNEEAAINLKNGYITGNYAESGGGGIRTFASKFHMSGGFINSNYANLSEGGGLSVNEYGTGEILAGYINNNVSNTHQHWGGGGIFSANDSTLYIKRIVVTDNDAGGYGGGVAGCSTGRAFVYQEDGGAIYGNTAVDRNSGNPHVSGGESTKAEDHLYPTSVFRQNGYEDYFCAFNSIISGTMLGGGAANWTGTVDGIPVTIAKDEDVASTYLMGLVSNPAASDIKKAQENARVYVNGNESYTHGGGVLGNGYLVIGTTESLEVYARLKVEASKEMTGADLEDGQFRFIIEDMHNGFLVAKGTNTADGDIVFDHLIPFTEEGTYEYLIYEDRTSENGEYEGILMDTTEYKLTVVVEKTIEWLQGSVRKERYVISSMVVQKRNGGDWETVQAIYQPNNPDNKPVTLSLTKGSSFHNVIAETTKFSVMKKWVGDVAADNITVQLLQNGMAYGEPVALSSANNWTYTWAEELPLYDVDHVTGEKIYYQYTVKELTAFEEYKVEYDSFNVTDSKSVWIPYNADQLIEGQEYIIVSPNGEYVLHMSSLSGYHTLTERDKATAARQDEPIVIDGKRYENYFYDNAISAASIYKAENHSGNLILKSIVVQDNMPLTSNWENGDKVLKSAWWPLKNMYVGNVRTCFGTDDVNSKDMIVFENNKFDAVDYNPGNSNAAKLYTRAATSAESQTVFMITNTKVEAEETTYKINITKVSAENREVLLSGAKFALYHADENGEADLSRQIVFSKDGQGVYRYLTAKESTDVLPTDIYDATTVRGGKLIFTELPKGNYVLVEVEAPNGYLVIEPMLITVGEDSGQENTYPITIEDQVYQEAYELPDTGGLGTKVYTAGGILLLMISALLYMERKNRRKGGTDST